MSDPNVDMNHGAQDGARTLIAQAAAASVAAHRALDASIDDFFLDDAGRLDEQTRVAVARLLRALVGTVAAELRDHTVRLLRAQGDPALASADEAFARLRAAGVLRDPELMAELVGRVRQELLAGMMPAQAPDEPDRPSLVNRFVQHGDRVLAQGSMALLVAESRRHGLPDHGPLARTDLPAELHHRLVWWAAAALRGAGGAVDLALAEAAARSLAAHDEGDRLEAVVMRLAAVIDAPHAELPDLMSEALGDRRVTLFAALLAHGLGVDYGIARDLVLDADGARLWVALRALDFPRAAIARIGVALGEGDPRRDVEGFAQRLDAVMAIAPHEARDALAALRLPRDFRAAIVALERGA